MFLVDMMSTPAVMHWVSFSGRSRWLVIDAFELPLAHGITSGSAVYLQRGDPQDSMYNARMHRSTGARLR